MAIKNAYILDLLERTKKRNPGEPEFIQAVTEVFTSLEPVVEQRKDLVDSRNIETHSEEDTMAVAYDKYSVTQYSVSSILGYIEAANVTDMEPTDYPEFLRLRRTMMAKKIQEYYYSL